MLQNELQLKIPDNVFENNVDNETCKYRSWRAAGDSEIIWAASLYLAFIFLYSTSSLYLAFIFVYLRLPNICLLILHDLLWIYFQYILSHSMQLSNKRIKLQNYISWNILCAPHTAFYCIKRHTIVTPQTEIEYRKSHLNALLAFCSPSAAITCYCVIVIIVIINIIIMALIITILILITLVPILTSWPP